MTTQVQIRRGSTLAHEGFIGAVGEITVDTDLWSVRVHDGVTPGGNLLLSGPILDGKADLFHTHEISDVNNLQITLDGKADSSHGHDIADVLDLQLALDGKADSSHGHAIGDVAGLISALADKAPLVHTHVIANVVGLQDALDNKTDIGHIHSLSDITGLESALYGKAETLHTHWYEDIGGLTDALATKADVSHTHAISDVTGLQATLDLKLESADIAGLASTTYVDTAISNLVDTAPATLDTLNELAAALGDDPNFATTVTTALAGKADATHVHDIADVTGLQTSLDAKISIADLKTLVAGAADYAAFQAAIAAL